MAALIDLCYKTDTNLVS